MSLTIYTHRCLAPVRSAHWFSAFAALASWFSVLWPLANVASPRLFCPRLIAYITGRGASFLVESFSGFTRHPVVDHPLQMLGPQKFTSQTLEELPPRCLPICSVIVKDTSIQTTNVHQMGKKNHWPTATLARERVKINMLPSRVVYEAETGIEHNPDHRCQLKKTYHALLMWGTNVPHGWNNNFLLRFRGTKKEENRMFWYSIAGLRNT